MESTYNLRVISYCMYGAIIHILLVASVQTKSVHLGPAEGFRQFSDVIFPGEKFTLQCVWDGLTTCNISMFFHDTAIYEEGGFQSQDSGFTNSRSSNCSLNIQINNVNLQHKGIYKCLVQNGNTTMEDTYHLNVVTGTTRCLVKYNIYESSFQLSCYIFNLHDQSNFQTWEIVEPEGNSEIFTHFYFKRLPRKSVGVSHVKITKENLNDQYKFSHFNDTSRNCSFNFEPSIDKDVSTPTITTSDLPAHQRYSMSSLRYTSAPHTSANTSEQPEMKWIIIIVAVTVSFLLVSVCLTIIICKTKGRLSCKGRNVNETHTKGDLVQTGTVLSKLSENVNPGFSSYDEIQRKSERVSMNDKHNRNTINSDSQCEPYSTVDIHKFTFQDANFQDDSSINTTNMVDYSVYEAFEEDKTEEDIHYDVLDPTKNDTLD